MSNSNNHGPVVEIGQEVAVFIEKVYYASARNLYWVVTPVPIHLDKGVRRSDTPSGGCELAVRVHQNGRVPTIGIHKLRRIANSVQDRGSWSRWELVEPEEEEEESTCL